MSGITLNLAISNWNSNHEASQRIRAGEYDSNTALKADGIGRTILFTNSKEEGWKIRELGYGFRPLAWLARVIRWLGLGYQDTVLTLFCRVELFEVLFDKTIIKKHKDMTTLIDNRNAARDKSIEQSNLKLQKPELDLTPFEANLEIAMRALNAAKNDLEPCAKGLGIELPT